MLLDFLKGVAIGHVIDEHIRRNWSIVETEAGTANGGLCARIMDAQTVQQVYQLVDEWAIATGSDTMPRICGSSDTPIGK